MHICSTFVQEMSVHAKRKREEEQERTTSSVSLGSDLPRVLLAISFSFLDGEDRQSLSLVCKYWCALEKDPASWPNKLRLEVKPSKSLVARLQGKRFDQFVVAVSLPYHSIPLLQSVKVKYLDLKLLLASDGVEILNQMKFPSAIECLSIHCPTSWLPLQELSSLTSLTVDGSAGSGHLIN